MNRLLNRQKDNEKGSVSIEAAISLTAFLFFFIMIYSILTICRAQARIQVAINNTANEISQYSYVYGLSGLGESLAKFQEEASKDEEEIDNVIGSTIQVFDSIQALGDKASKIDITDPQGMLNTWGDIKDDIDTGKSSAMEIKQKIEEMAENPQKLLFGMAKIIGSNALEVAKSRLIAEPISKALVRKHLKRSEKDTAEAFCQSVGVVPKEYFGKTTYYNGLDFSNSTLFPLGSPEITIQVTYKVKMLQLLPIDLEFTITQSAVTRGWLHGDKTTYEATDLIGALESDKKPETTIWNSTTVSARVDAIRGEELAKLKAANYNGVSGDGSFHAYDKSTNTFVMIATCNPIYGVDSVDQIDKSYLKEQLKIYADNLNSATDNRQVVYVKEKDKNGNILRKPVNCGDTPKNKKIILVVPTDTGVKELVESMIAQGDYNGVTFEVKAGYGTGKKLPEKTE